MHNNLMAAGSRDCPPMLAIGRYPQWQSRFLRYIDTRPNGNALRKCILNDPYIPTTVLVQAVAATDNSPAEHTTVETPMNMYPANKAHFESEKEAIHLILTGIRDEIYSTVDACQTALETWEAIERLQQEWSRFVTIAKQQHKLDEVSFYKLFDILKQYQKEVNELHAERLARNANPLALPEWSRFVMIVKQQHKLDEVSYHKLFDILKQYQKEVKELHTNEEIDEHELEAHYSYMEKIQEVPTANTCTDSEPLEQETVDNAWVKHTKDQFRAPTAKDMKILIQTCLTPLALKIQNYSFIFVHELKQEMHADLKYVESLEKEIDELESDKAEFSNMYDMIL
nr:hypothetical protein [Tanacetum cinerariifolium]